MFAAGTFSHLSIENATNEAAATSKTYGVAAVFFIFLFTAIFGATWLTVPWLYPAEIFPLEVRAKGHAWGVVGWSLGNGMLTLLCPGMYSTYFIPLLPTLTFCSLHMCEIQETNNLIGLIVMFSALGSKTLYIFGICNIITLPMVYCLYPETNQRTLEEINLVFSSDSIWTWDAERNFKNLKNMQGDSAGLLPVAAGGGGGGDEGEQPLLDPETGLPRESDVPAVLNGNDEGRKEAQVKMKYVLALLSSSVP